MQVCPELGPAVSCRRLLPEAKLLGGTDAAIGGCTCDSRRVRPGDLFAAIAGSRDDGRRHIAEALVRGAAAVMLEQPGAERFAELVQSHPGATFVVVPNVRESFARLCHELAGNPSRRLKLIGVTGTNGKTTTACLIAGVLRAADCRVGVLGTLGYLDGRTIEEATHTTPPADRLAQLLARMTANGCSHAVMEVSSHALAQSRVAGAEFDAACVTNVAHDHLDYHGTLGEYRRAKAKLFDHLGVEGFVVLNADDPGSAGYVRQLRRPVLTVGIRAAAEITATPVEQFPSEQTFLLHAGGETIPVRTAMIGRHHIYNCLTAAAVGLAYNIELTAVVRGLESVGHVPGRLERIECGQPFGVYVDFAHTHDALRSALETLRQITAGRLICVFGASGRSDRQKRPLMGWTAQQAADIAILTTDDPRDEDPRAIFRDVLAGCPQPRTVEVVPDRAEAIHQALSSARQGDCVLIAGRGHESHQLIGSDRLPFDDREVAREWLYDSGRCETTSDKPRSTSH
jgi:UDP-N-acetylmuramoyl-L-alanyl-D-glutamate--2,6-diaminopimelate ligase